MPSGWAPNSVSIGSATVLGNPPPRSLSAITKTQSASRPLDEWAVMKTASRTGTHCPVSASSLAKVTSSVPEGSDVVNSNCPVPPPRA